MGNELGESNIFFRAQAGYEGGALEAETLEVEHKTDRLYTHIGYNGVTIGDPYISMTGSIETALLKYSYGRRATAKTGAFRYNKNLSKILLINLPKQNACKTASDVPTPTNGYFTTDVLVRDNIGPIRIGNFIRADCEAVAYRKIDEDCIHEVHPMLADVLFALKAIGNKRAYDEVVTKIITGELSVETVNKIFFEDGMCVETYNGQGFNDVERAFIESFYGERKNIVDTCTQCFPTLDENNDTRSKMQLGTAVRVGLIKRLLTEFIMKKLSAEVAENISKEAINNFMMTIEEDMVMSTCGTNFGKRKEHLYGNVVLNLEGGKIARYIYGIKYQEVNKQGQVLTYGIDEEQKEIEKINGENKLVIKRFRYPVSSIFRMADVEEESKKEHERQFAVDENGIPLRLIERIKLGEKPPTREEIKRIFREVIEHYKRNGENFPIETILFGVCKVMLDPSNVPIRIKEKKIGRKIEKEFQIEKCIDEEYRCNHMILKQLLKRNLTTVSRSPNGEYMFSKQDKVLCDDFLGAIFDISEECDPKFKIEKVLRALGIMQRGKTIKTKEDLQAKYAQAQKQIDRGRIQGEIKRQEIELIRFQEIFKIAQNRVKKISGHGKIQEEQGENER